jgi:DNA-binding beta-propeller fold protein YncE
MYVGSQYKVDKVDMATGAAQGVGGSVFASSNPMGVATNGTHLFVSHQAQSISRVQSVNLVTQVVSHFAGSPGGSKGSSGDGGLATAALIFDPIHVAYDPIRKVVYIADAGNHKVRKVDQTTGIISTLAVS